MKKQGKQFGKRIVGTFGIPVFTLLLFMLICNLRGIALFNTAGHMLTFIRSTVVIGFTSWALSLNLTSGRFDFSIGAIALLSSVIAARVTLIYDLPAFAMFLLSVIIGAVLGLISGLLYVLLKLPPIITSLGVTLIYEAMTFVVTKGEGVLLSTSLHLLKISSTRNLIIMALTGLIIMIFICNETVFGYEMRALQTGQLIAVNTGIREHINAVICYTLSGALMGVVGVVNLTTKGTASVALNFSSISTMFVAFLPMFVGGFIGRYSEERLGILLGAITSALITLGFVRLEVSNQMQSLINALILLLFLIFLNNEGKLKMIWAKSKTGIRDGETK
ncbi:MAG: sugar ABC transporter permease [bacterium]|nr:sugar ABC transporter permease [bacterium]